jgi:hypothetical protein
MRLALASIAVGVASNLATLLVLWFATVVGLGG